MITPDNLEEVAAAICSIEGLYLLDRAGRGSFKKVYSAKSSKGEVLALKIIKDAALSPRTHREIDAIHRCNHPFIAKCLKVGQCCYEGSQYEYLIEEFFDGGSLSDLLENDKTLNLHIILEIGLKLLDALKHLEILGLVHRDIKPENIMFRKGSYDPILVDFGIVRDLNAPALTQSWGGVGPGTPYYASPEQLNNQKHLINWRTDQFSLGVVLVISAFNTHPFQKINEIQYSPAIVERVANRGERNAGLLKKLDDLGLTFIEKMTRPWPVQRFRTATDLKIVWEKYMESI